MIRTGFGLFVGVNETLVSAYGDNHRMPAAKGSAELLMKMTKRVGRELYKKQNLIPLTDQHANWADVKAHLKKLRDHYPVGKEAFLALTISCHGFSSEVMDKTCKDENGEVMQIQFLCFRDQMITEQEFRGEINKFGSNILVFVVLDCCYGDGIPKGLDYARGPGFKAFNFQGMRIRQTAFEEAYKRQYKPGSGGWHPLKDCPTEAMEPKEHICYLSACGKDQLARLHRSGKKTQFVHNIFQMWREGIYPGNYYEFQRLLAERSSKKRQPQIDPAHDEVGATHFKAFKPIDFTQGGNANMGTDYINWKFWSNETPGWNVLTRIQPDHPKQAIWWTKTYKRGKNSSGIKIKAVREYVETLSKKPEYVTVLFVKDMEMAQEYPRTMMMEDLISARKGALTKRNGMYIVYDSDNQVAFDNAWTDKKVRIKKPKTK